MALQTLDVPTDLMNRVTAAARMNEMDVDAYVAQALAFALEWNLGTMQFSIGLWGGGSGRRADHLQPGDENPSTDDDVRPVPVL